MAPPHVPLHVVEEVEALQSLYGETSVRLHSAVSELRDIAATVSLEIDVRACGDDGHSLVWVTLLVRLPPAYPSGGHPEVEVYRSRGLQNAQIDQVLEVVKESIAMHGLQDTGCLLVLIDAAASALGRSGSECCICLEHCSPAEAVSAACGDVFHERCLQEWAALKKIERTKKADEATKPLLRQREALERDIAQAEEREREANEAVRNQEYIVNEAEVWAVRMQRKAQVAMGSADEDSDLESSGDDNEMGEEDVPDESKDKDGREGRHTKIKFNNTGWGEGKRKNYKPSTTRNRGRAKKYIHKVMEQLELMKEKEKDAMREKAQTELTDWENAARDLREARSVLDKVRAVEGKAQAKTQEIRTQWEMLGRQHAAERDGFINVPIPCPVCTNVLDPDGVMPELEKNKKLPALEEDTGNERKRRSAEAAAGRVDIRLELTKVGGTEDTGTVVPKDTGRVIGIYTRDDEPAEGFPDGRPTYTGPKGNVLQFVPGPGQNLWCIGLGRLRKACLETMATTPDYAPPDVAWQVATPEGWKTVRALRATCVNARKEIPAVTSTALATNTPCASSKEVDKQAEVAESEARRGGAADSGPRTSTEEELVAMLIELVDLCDGDEEKIMECIKDMIEALHGDKESEQFLTRALEELSRTSPTAKRKKPLSPGPRKPGGGRTAKAKEKAPQTISPVPASPLSSLEPP